MPSTQKILVAFFLFVVNANASSFLSRMGESAEQLTPEMEVTILQEIDAMLQNVQGVAKRERLAHIEEVLSTTFKAMPKTKSGRLHHAAARYVLHSYFVQRHAWYVRGIADLGDLPSPNESSSPTGILQDRVDDFIQGAFERRLGGDGLDLSGIALLVATFENLVHGETMKRLDATLTVMNMDLSNGIEVSEADDVIDTYFMGYIMGLNYSKVSPNKLKLVKTKVREVYPTWDQTQKFLRDVRARTGFHKNFFSRSDIEAVVEQVGDEYGKWQDKECQSLKQQLLMLEDRSIGTNGSGRVRIADFYGSALRDGNWQFSETMEYLQNNGALDLHSDVPRVVIPNYINSPSNCLASSKFYSVCCINECETLMDRIEHRFAAPHATPSQIAEFVSTLPSSTVSAGRALHSSLLGRLDEIASTHGGHVPLHGRLFAQWMHHAYPRECPYPHLAGTVQPQTPQDYAKEKQLKPTVKKDQMAEIVRVRTIEAENAQKMESDEVTVWNHHEELYVTSPDMQRARGKQTVSTWSQRLRPLLYLGVATAAVWTLVGRWISGAKSAAFACNLGGKDVYV